MVSASTPHLYSLREDDNQSDHCIDRLPAQPSSQLSLHRGQNGPAAACDWKLSADDRAGFGTICVFFNLIDDLYEHLPCELCLHRVHQRVDPNGLHHGVDLSHGLFRSCPFHHQKLSLRGK